MVDNLLEVLLNDTSYEIDVEEITDAIRTASLSLAPLFLPNAEKRFDY